MQEYSVENAGEMTGGSFVPLPELEPVEYPTRVETYGEKMLRAYLDGTVSEKVYLDSRPGEKLFSRWGE